MVTKESQAGALTVIGLSRALEIAINETGLTSSQFRALSLINAGITSSGVLARFLDVRPPTVSTVMNGLADEGLVRRYRDEDDRRRVDYEVTSVGAAALERANDAARLALSTLADELSADDRSAAFLGLDLWGQALESRRSSR